MKPWQRGSCRLCIFPAIGNAGGRCAARLPNQFFFGRRRTEQCCDVEDAVAVKQKQSRLQTELVLDDLKLLSAVAEYTHTITSCRRVSPRLFIGVQDRRGRARWRRAGEASFWRSACTACAGSLFSRPTALRREPQTDDRPINR